MEQGLSLWSEDQAQRSVVVKNIPSEITEKDLTIHFLRRKNGGGQVESVTKGESAVITFEAREDVEKVLEREHKVNGRILRVQPYKQTQQCCDSELFSKVFAEVTTDMLKMDAQEALTVLTAVNALTNVQWRQKTERVFILTGSLTKIQEAHQCLREVLRQRSPSAKMRDLPSCTQEPSLVEKIQRNVQLSAIEKADYEEHALMPVKYEAEPKFEAFLSRFYKEKITEIEQKHDIKISWNEQETKIILIPSSSCNADRLRAASKAFVKIYQDIHASVTSKHFCLQDSDGNERKAILKISKELPVLIERSEDRTQWIIYGKEESVEAFLTELGKVYTVCLEPLLRSSPERRLKNADNKTASRATPENTGVQFQQLLFGNVKVSAYQGDITDQHVDAIVNAANENLAHIGGLALAISRKGGPSVNRESKAVIQRNGSLQVGQVVHTGSGNLPCKFVIHAVGPQWRQEGEKKSRYLLREVVLNSLYEAEELQVESIAFPAISSGIFGVPKEICAEVMFDAVEEYSGTLAPQQSMSVSDIRFINIDDPTVKVFREEFDKRYRSTKGAHKSSVKMVDAGHSSVCRGPTPKEASQKSNETLLGSPARDWTTREQARKDSKDMKQDNHENTCPVCLDTFKNPRILKKCKHKFCKVCIDEALKVKNQCPFCKTPCEATRGNQPRGNMSWTVNSTTHLPGFESHGTITVRYSIPTGVQSDVHPNPGQLYAGTDRVAYLPDCPEGNEVLQLLKRAFDAGLVFTVGTSRTSGISNQVTWNGIGHKTSIHGGPTNYGYPDPTYLATVKEDLAAKGIQ